MSRAVKPIFSWVEKPDGNLVLFRNGLRVAGLAPHPDYFIEGLYVTWTDDRFLDVAYSGVNVRHIDLDEAKEFLEERAAAALCEEPGQQHR